MPEIGSKMESRIYHFTFINGTIFWVRFLSLHKNICMKIPVSVWVTMKHQPTAMATFQSIFTHLESIICLQISMKPL